MKWGEGLRKFLYQVYKVRGTINFGRFLAHMQGVSVKASAPFFELAL
jgi:hypothetical protein